MTSSIPRPLTAAAIALCALLGLPVLGVLGSWLTMDAAAWGTLAHQADTVLPRYAGQSVLLALGVALGTAALGGGAAAFVTLFEFPGRRLFEWALLLPLAMPAYVLAYAYTDALQASGPLQQALRDAFGWQGVLWPDVRSLPGAIVLFVLALYPYVYLLTRTALAERGVQMMEAARLLGAGLARRIVSVALPMARPAIAAGVALALMETLADYGVGAYFGLTTFSTGVYHAWLAMNDRVAAAQLASVLLLVVAVLLMLERRAQARLRFAASRAGSAQAADARPVVLQGAWAAGAWFLCALPVVLGFVLPVALMLRLTGLEMAYGEVGLPWEGFGRWAWASFRLAAVASVAAAVLAFGLAFLMRAQAGAGRGTLDRTLGASARVVSLGYAIPGAVVAVGILLPLGWLHEALPAANLPAWVTGTALGVLFAYGVRFTSVALQSVEAGYARVPRQVDDTARMLGVGPGRVLRELHWPLLRRSVLAAALLVFVDVMKELPATLVLRPFGSDTLAVVAYNLARDERLAEAALPSLAIVAVGLIPVALLSRALRRNG